MTTASRPASPDAPPLFAKFRQEGSATRAHIVRSAGEPGDLTVGRQRCSAQAPNGLSAEGEVTFAESDDAALRYRKVADLLFRENRQETTDPRELLVGGGVSVLPAGMPGEPSMVLWQHGKCVAAKKWNATSDRRTGIRELAGAEEADHLQMWTEFGPSVIARCHGRTELHLAGAQGRSGKLALPHLAGSAKLSAYWGFLKHGFVEAADALGRLIAAEAVAADNESPEVIVGAHWAARFERGAVAEVLAARLRNSLREDADTCVMQWVLACEVGSEVGSPERGHLFVRAVSATRERPPLYTETLRLLIETIDSGVRFSRGVYGGGDSEGVAWVMRLASSAYWNAEQTTYRGIEPGWPDPQATGAEVPSVAKKKISRGLTLLLSRFASDTNGPY